MMMIGSLQVYVTSFLFFLVFLRFLPTKKSHRNPLLKNWPFLGMLPGFVLQIPRIFDWMAEALEASDLNFSFKGLWFSGKDLLFTADPKNIHHILSINSRNYHKGPEHKKIFEFLGNGILAADGEIWEDLRKTNHTIFHRQDFVDLSLSSNISKLKKDLIPFLDNAAEGNVIIDLQDVFHSFMFDVASVLTLGFDPKSLSVGLPELELSRTVDLTEEALFYRYFKPMVFWKLQSWLGIGLERKMRDLKLTVNQMLAKTISSRREELGRGEKEPSTDLLAYYINVDTAKYKHLKTGSDKFVRDVVFSLLLAGRDTTSVALTWFFWLLSKHPQVMTKIRQEINTKFDAADLDKLVYLHGALYETLRLYPPVPLDLKSPLESDVLPSGHKVGAHSKIVISSYALGRMRAVWGEDASEFKPERWISDEGQLKLEPSYKFLAFYSGPRACLGKHLAMTQMKIVAVDIIQNYNFKIVEGQKIEPASSVVLNMKHGFKVTVMSKKI